MSEKVKQIPGSELKPGMIVWDISKLNSLATELKVDHVDGSVIYFTYVSGEKTYTGTPFIKLFKKDIYFSYE